MLEETRLGSQHAILATHQAAAALSGVEEIEALSENYKTSRPEFTANTIKYDTQTMTLFDDGTVSLLTVNNRIRCDLALPDVEDGYQHQYLNDEDWELTESTISRRDGDYYLNLGFRRPKPEKQVEHGVTTRTGQFSALTSASSTSPLPQRRISRPAENSGIGTGSLSGFGAISNRLVHSPRTVRSNR
ncbi:hypothetical protein SAMN05216218_1308 [Halorientalis regularis]|uniref:Transposase n=1 Tax=Halorientalis regularis TaxID=660518 RepID=A0A1G7TTW9_9EURY|nr:hypothetical protein [Halorientalis regularis]SDG38786.1 hypothetical protein SAMN05216218_1308 [Halorientalis regularis]